MGSKKLGLPLPSPSRIYQSFEIQCEILDFMRADRTISAEVKWSLAELVSLSNQAIKNPKDPYWPLAMEQCRTALQELFWDYCEVQKRCHFLKTHCFPMPYAQEEFAKYGLVYHPKNVFKGQYPFA